MDFKVAGTQARASPRCRWTSSATGLTRALLEEGARCRPASAASTCSRRCCRRDAPAARQVISEHAPRLETPPGQSPEKLGVDHRPWLGKQRPRAAGSDGRPRSACRSRTAALVTVSRPRFAESFVACAMERIQADDGGGRGRCGSTRAEVVLGEGVRRVPRDPAGSGGSLPRKSELSGRLRPLGQRGRARSATSSRSRCSTSIRWARSSSPARP
jgi:hypothetical protein